MYIFKGHCPALVTPFTKDGKDIDYLSFQKLIDYQLENGTSALLFLGTTGESSTLTKTERENIVSFAVNYVNKRVPVIVGAGTNCTQVTIENCKLYESLGADALLIVTPYYNKCTQNGLISHYTEIAKNTTLPIILYNVPARTGVNILPATVKKLSEIQSIVGIKEASGNISQVVDICQLCDHDFSIYSGDDALTLPILSVGGSGIISVAGNIIPKIMSEICSNYFSGNTEQSKRLQLSVNALIHSLFSEVNPIPIKKALSEMSMCKNILRLPLTSMEQESSKSLITNLQNLNLI